MKRRRLWIATLALISILIAMPVEAQETLVIDFEAPAAGVTLDPLFYSELGVRFGGGPTVVAYDEEFASSGTNGLEMCYQAESCTTPFAIHFDSPQESVGVSVGYSRLPNVDLRVAPPEEGRRVQMQAFDANGTPITSDWVEIDDRFRIPVEHQLSVTSAEGQIVRVAIGWSDADLPMNHVVIDDLQFDPFDGFVELTSEPATRLILERIEEPRSIRFTNLGNMPAVFTLGLRDDTGVFEVVETSCTGELGPAESCEAVVSFNPPRDAEYEDAIVLRSPDGEDLYSLRVTGLLIPVTAPIDDEPTSQPAPTVPEPPPGTPPHVPQPVPNPPRASDQAGDMDPDLVLTGIVGVTIFSSVLLARLWPTKSGQASSQVRTAIIRVVPESGRPRVTTNEGQLVPAIQVSSGTAITSITEEDQP